MPHFRPIKHLLQVQPATLLIIAPVHITCCRFRPHCPIAAATSLTVMQLPCTILTHCNLPCSCLYTQQPHMLPAREQPVVLLARHKQGLGSCWCCHNRLPNTGIKSWPDVPGFLCSMNESIWFVPGTLIVAPHRCLGACNQSNHGEAAVHSLGDATDVQCDTKPAVCSTHVSIVHMTEALTQVTKAQASLGDDGRFAFSASRCRNVLCVIRCGCAAMQAVTASRDSQARRAHMQQNGRGMADLPSKWLYYAFEMFK
jgi:hypothetical protein